MINTTGRFVGRAIHSFRETRESLMIRLGACRRKRGNRRGAEGAEQHAEKNFSRGFARIDADRRFQICNLRFQISNLEFQVLIRAYLRRSAAGSLLSVCLRALCVSAVTPFAK